MKFAILFLAAAAAACTGGVSGDGCHACPAALTLLDAHHGLGDGVTTGNLTVWPVFTDAPLDVGEVYTLEEALGKGLAEVREQGAAATAERAEAPEGLDELELALVELEDAATVGTLVVENRSDRPILICAGTVVEGGNQDRQIGQDFVVQAGATVPVDAFCVEQGRWNGVREGVATGDLFVLADYYAPASTRGCAQYEKDQDAVWTSVANTRLFFFQAHESDGDDFNALNDPSLRDSFRDPVVYARGAAESTSLAVVLDAAAEAAPDALDATMKAVREHFDASPDAVGFAYAIDGRAVAVRTFANAPLFRRHFDAFLRTMAHEAKLAAAAREGPAPAARVEDVVALVASVEKSDETVTPTAALNRNGVRASGKGWASACYLPKGDGVLAVTRDWTMK